MQLMLYKRDLDLQRYREVQSYTRETQTYREIERSRESYRDDIQPLDRQRGQEKAREKIFNYSDNLEIVATDYSKERKVKCAIDVLL